MKHIAVVEDEALMREELADMLRRADYAVTEITDFADVTGQLLSLAPDLVLLDLNLPEVSGFQICRDIKQRSALPVLVLTSRDQLRDEVARARTRGGRISHQALSKGAAAGAHRQRAQAL